MSAPSNDDTVIQRRPGQPRRRRWPVIAAVGLALGGAAAIGASVHWFHAAEPPPVAAILPLASEAAILAEPAGDPRVVRFALNPQVVVLDFVTLARQGNMLNRVATLVEKAGLPRDRVLNDRELADAIQATGATPETFYYGHDYRAADIARFFALADRDHIALNFSEEALREFAQSQGWLTPGAVGALISLAALGADPLMDARGRATILHHELAHGEYFTNPAYADYTRHFWQSVLSEAERSQFRRFLSQDGYDAGIEDLMMNEMQAYLMHTRDPRFFTAKAIGIAPDRLALVQAQFLLGMPPGWLRDCTTVPAPGN